MFHDMKHTATTIGQALFALPPAARAVTDWEHGRGPAECDLRMMDLQGDLNV